MSGLDSFPTQPNWVPCIGVGKEKSFMKRKWIVVLIFASLMSLAQNSEWQHGVILAVQQRTNSQGTDSKVGSYDITVRIGKHIYVVSYTDPNNSTIAQYRVGADFVVRVNGDTLTFNDLQGNPHTLKILRSETTSESQKQ